MPSDRIYFLINLKANIVKYSLRDEISRGVKSCGNENLQLSSFAQQTAHYLNQRELRSRFFREKSIMRFLGENCAAGSECGEVHYPNL